MIVLDLHNKLSQRNLEEALKVASSATKTGWIRSLKKDGLIIDLSKIGWVEPVATVRVALLIERALLDSAEVTVRLPLPTPTRAEERVFASAAKSKDRALRDKAKYTALNINRRAKAADALRHLRFKEALAHEHIKAAPGTLQIIEEYDWSIAEEGLAQQQTENDKTSVLESPTDAASHWDFEVAYGLQWIPDPRNAEGKDIIDHLSGVNVLADTLTHPSGRVSAADGRTLAHVFLKELVENTIDHASRKFALVAAWRRPQGYDVKESEVFDCEQEFVSWCRRHPLIEVIVGDSGDGIPYSLREEYNNRQPRLPKKLDDASPNTRILAWAFDKWSSKLASDQRRGTRGLYRVQRIVRKYDGCITLRSELSYVGIECGFSTPPHYIFQDEAKKLPRSPGTIVHVRLPVMLSERLPARTINAALHRARLEVVDFHNLDWKNEDRALDQICERIYERCGAFSASLKPICLIADFAFVKIERRTLERLLIRLVQIAHPVALVVANVLAPSADSAAETIHSIAEQIAPRELRDASAEQPEALHVRDAILFQYTNGEFAWVGASEEIAEHLNRLWEEGTIASSTLVQSIPNLEERNNLIRQFAEAYHVAHRLEGGGLGLNFNKEDIREKLREHVVELLTKRVQIAGSPAVRSGTFRTPSLELVSRYTRVKQLLEEIGLDRASATLAEKCTDVEKLQKAERLQIIADWNTSRDLIESFRDYLCARLQLAIDNVELNQISPGDPPVVREDCKIILFTDLVLTGDTVGALISQVIRARTVPTLVVSIFDARRHNERGKPFHALGYQIEMVSLAQIDILIQESPSTSNPVNISPITHRPESEVSMRDDDERYEIKRDRLVEMIQKEDALYFDHIVRPNGRHFCFYLDPFKLLGALDTSDQADLSEIGKEVIHHFYRAIDEWLNPEEQIDCIYFPNLPRSERPSPTKLIIAKKLAETYRTQVSPVDFASQVSLPLPENHSPDSRSRSQQWRAPRSVQPLLFDLPDLEDVPTATDLDSQRDPTSTVLIVDWGSVTGSAIRTSIRYAIARGARRIFAIVFLSQLPFGEEEFLTYLKQIGTRTTRNNEPQIDECDVTVKFLASFPIQVYEAQLCPYCRQLNRLNEERRFFPSEMLSEFIKDAKKRLRPRYLDGVDGIRSQHRWRQVPDSIENQASTWINPRSNVIQIAEFRTRLERAKTWTSTRWELYEDLTEIERLTDNEDSRAKLRRGCLITLLAAEWLWLKQEPLSLTRFKKRIAKLAVDVIKDRECSAQERLDAIVVLRTASKDAFAQNLPNLFDVVIEDETESEENKLSLVSQLLYCAFTYLQREYLVGASLKPLVDALTQCASRIQDLLNQPNPVIVLRIGRTVNALEQYGRFMLHSENETAPQNAWSQLKEILGRNYHVHHPVCVAFDSLRFGTLEAEMEHPFIDPPEINWAAKRDSWEQKCEPFIIETLLPLLRPLREIFEGTDAKVMVGVNRAETLALVDKRIFSDISTLSHLLGVFAGDPTAVQQPGLWKSFIQARDALWRLLIDPGELRRDDSRQGGSALVRVLQDCPTDVFAIVEDLANGANREGNVNISLKDNLISRSRAFCHSATLRETVSELLRNINEHVVVPTEELQRNEVLTPPDTSPRSAVPVEIEVFDDNEKVYLQIKNGGTLRESDTPGRGLQSCAERLRPYAATIRILDTDLQPPWLFGVKLGFIKE
jgi:hypothetical protein